MVEGHKKAMKKKILSITTLTSAQVVKNGSLTVVSGRFTNIPGVDTMSENEDPYYGTTRLINDGRFQNIGIR